MGHFLQRLSEIESENFHIQVSDNATVKTTFKINTSGPDEDLKVTGKSSKSNNRCENLSIQHCHKERAACLWQYLEMFKGKQPWLQQ